MSLGETIGKMQGEGCNVTFQPRAMLRALDVRWHQSLEEVGAQYPEIGLC